MTVDKKKMNELQRHHRQMIIKYSRHPIARCFAEAGLTDSKYITDVLTESMFQYQQGMRRDYTVKRPLRFLELDRRFYFRHVVLVEFCEVLLQHVNKCLMLENIITYTMENGQIVEEMDDFSEYHLLDELVWEEIGNGHKRYKHPLHYIEENNIPIYYFFEYYLTDPEHSPLVLSINYYRWRAHAFQSPCRPCFGTNVAFSPRIYLYPRYYSL